MSKENYLSEAALRDNPVKRYKLKLREGSVTTEKIATEAVTAEKLSGEAVVAEKIKDGAISTNKIASEAVTYDKIKDRAVITEKLQDSAITTVKVEDKAVTNPKLGDSSVDSRVIREGNVQTRHIANDSITTDKVATKAITNDKIADDTLTLDKFDEDLRQTIQVATGIPSDLIKKIESISEDIVELKDSEFPIVLSLTASNDVNIENTIVKYTVTSKKQLLTPDTLELKKNGVILTNAPKAEGSVTTPIQANRETFALTVGKKEHTGKSTSVTRNLCYYGASPVAVVSSLSLKALTKTVSTSVSINPTITTQNGDYIWIIVPSYLAINRVTSAGFNVTLAAPQMFTTELGEFRAYRTQNQLTNQKWDLVIG